MPSSVNTKNNNPTRLRKFKFAKLRIAMRIVCQFIQHYGIVIILMLGNAQVSGILATLHSYNT